MRKSKLYSAKSIPFVVEVKDGRIMVKLGSFSAVYDKAPGLPQLILRERSKTEDHELLAGAHRTAAAMARDLGWIV